MTFPGGYVFVQQAAKDTQNPALAAQINRLAPVQRALTFVTNAATADADSQTRFDLLARANDEIKILEAGKAAIQYAIDHVCKERGIGNPVTDQNRERLQPGTGRQSTRPWPPTIQSAPIDPNETGSMGTAAPPDWNRRDFDAARAEHERIDRQGIDEGPSGGYPVSNTNVNQSVNQRNIYPSSAATSGRTVKEGGNLPPPMHEGPINREPDESNLSGAKQPRTAHEQLREVVESEEYKQQLQDRFDAAQPKPEPKSEPEPESRTEPAAPVAEDVTTEEASRRGRKGGGRS